MCCGGPPHSLDGVQTASVLTFDSVFLISDGKVTSYSPTGRLNWHVATLATWPTLAERQSQRGARAAPHIMGSPRRRGVPPQRA